MVRIIVDDATRAKLDGTIEAVEICDESGRLIGYYRPLDDKEIPLSEEEIEEAMKQPGRPLKDILGDLARRE